MKKLLIIIIIGFIFVSFLAVMFTIQNVNRFTFNDDNGGNGEDYISLIDLIFSSLKKEFQSSYSITHIFIRHNTIFP